jgi:outer membrane lipoprotein-sorting protein
MILRRFFYVSVASVVVVSLAAPALAQRVPNPQPRPAHLKGQAAPLVPAPIAGIPAALAAQAPAPAAAPIAPVESPPAPVAQAPVAPPAPPTIESVIAAEPAAPAAAAETAPADPGAPLDLAAPSTAAPTDAPVDPATIVAAAPISAPTETQTLAKVNTYFNGIRTLVGNFTQVGPDGSKADGKFFLQKPGKVRFYYQRPSNTDIIADGKSLVVRDRKLATQDVYPLNQTPLKFLLDTNLDLARDSKVVAVYEEPGLVSVAIEEETTFGGKARVLIVFGTADQKNYELKQWTITDPQGLDTTIALSELDTATRPDEKLFAVDYKREITRN